jgi:Cu(I)/Ag(I) efflux system membrane fusion protein
MKKKPSESTEASAETVPTQIEHGTRQGRQWLLRVGTQSVAIIATVVVCIGLVGLAQRIGWIRSADDGSAAAMQLVGDEHSEHSNEYTCSMHPEIRQDSPGKCPICGMKLVPLATSSTKKREPKQPAAATQERHICPMMCTPASSEAGKCPVCAMPLVKADSSSGGDERSVSIDPAARRILGIRTAKVKEGEVYRTIRTVGGIEYDEQRVATIAAYVDGRIEELYAQYIGIQVAKGDALAVLYSPQLYSAQVEYLSSLSTPALNALTRDGDRLSNVARDNLSELGMTDSQLKILQSSHKAQKRLRITSPIGGTVIAKHKVEGDYVRTGEAIYRVVDLSTVWLMLDLYPSDAAAAKFGQQVEAEFQSLPGEVYTGRVAFIDPMVSPKTRTVSVRVEMTNFDGRLKPGDYATATIRVPAIARDEVYDPALAGKWISPMHPQIIRNEAGKCPICGMDLVPTRDLGFVDHPLPDQVVISVARSAVLMAGDNSVLYVEREPGVFEIREVTLGAMTDSEAVILGGVSAGETVATDGNFLIDSQMQLGGKPSLMDPARAAGATPSQPAGEQHAH